MLPGRVLARVRARFFFTGANRRRPCSRRIQQKPRRSNQCQTAERRPDTSWKMRTITAITSSRWINPPPMPPIRPNNHKIIRTTRIVQSMIFSSINTHSVSIGGRASQHLLLPRKPARNWSSVPTRYRDEQPLFHGLSPLMEFKDVLIALARHRFRGLQYSGAYCNRTTGRDNSNSQLSAVGE
jgi:hypothetical protein